VQVSGGICRFVYLEVYVGLCMYLDAPVGLCMYPEVSVGLCIWRYL